MYTVYACHWCVLILLIPCSHVLPVHPLLQVQSKVPFLELHVPLLRQGVDVQWLISEIKDGVILSIVTCKWHTDTNLKFQMYQISNL